MKAPLSLSLPGDGEGTVALHTHDAVLAGILRELLKMLIVLHLPGFLGKHVTYSAHDAVFAWVV